jgi:hypothetical protein
MSFIGRFFVILFAVMLASIAAGIAIAIGVLGPQWHVVNGDPAERVIFWGVAVLGSIFTGAIGILPLAVCIALAETFKIRSVLINTAAGALLLLAGYYTSGLARPSYEESIDEAPAPISHEAQLAAAAGAVFGLTYWLIAGRNAGRWREKHRISV